MSEFRVLHVASAIAPQYGGTTTAILGLCEALARVKGLTVELAATDADGPGGHLPASAFEGFPFRTHLFPVTRSERWKYCPSLSAWLRANAGRFDLLHLHGAWCYSTRAGRRSASACSRPYVFSPHGMLSGYSFARFPVLKRMYWNSIEKANSRNAASMFATSLGEADELRTLALPSPVRIVPLGVDAQAWTTPVDPGALRRLCGSAAADRPILLFLSRLHPKKGIVDFLLPAFARLKIPAFLAIAGGVDNSAPGYPAEVKAAIARLGVGDRVAWLGPIAPSERWGLFDGAAAFVLPSHQENFGLVVAEAMARGCPVVVSDRVQSCDHVVAADAGHVVPLGVEALAAAFAECVLVEPRQRAEMARRARVYSSENFRWDNVARMTFDMYRECVAK